MTDSNVDDVDPTARDQREIGLEMVEGSTDPGSVMAHAYRGEMDQATICAATVIAAILTRAFPSGDNPHYVLLVVVGVITPFFVAVLGFALWPQKGHAKGEFREGNADA